MFCGNNVDGPRKNGQFVELRSLREGPRIRRSQHRYSNFLEAAALSRQLFGRAYVFSSMDSVLRDFRYAIRLLLKDRGFFMTSVMALALGIGSVTAIFSVIDNVLLDLSRTREGRG